MEKSEAPTQTSEYRYQEFRFLSARHQDQEDNHESIGIVMDFISFLESIGVITMDQFYAFREGEYCNRLVKASRWASPSPQASSEGSQ